MHENSHPLTSWKSAAARAGPLPASSATTNRGRGRPSASRPPSACSPSGRQLTPPDCRITFRRQLDRELAGVATSEAVVSRGLQIARPADWLIVRRAQRGPPRTIPSSLSTRAPQPAQPRSRPESGQRPALPNCGSEGGAPCFCEFTGIDTDCNDDERSGPAERRAGGEQEGADDRGQETCRWMNAGRASLRSHAVVRTRRRAKAGASGS